MPRFEIEQYEIHAMTYTVEADSEAEAIKKRFDGKAEPMDGGLDLIGVCDERGLPIEANPDLASELRALGIACDKGVIPSIREIRRVD